MRRQIVLLVVTAVAGCTTTPAGDPGVIPAPRAGQIDRLIAEKRRAVILAEITSYYRDLSARDWDAFASHFWRGAKVVTIWEPDDEGRRVVFSSVPEFIAEVDPGPDIVFDETLTNAQVHVSGNVAVVWAEYRVRFGNADDMREWSGTDAFTLIRHLGIWKITALAFAPR